MRDDELDDILRLAARQRPEAGPGLTDRVLSDALRLMPGPKPGPVPVRRVRDGLWSRLAAAFGGGPVLAGVCSTLVLGLAAGYLSPTVVDLLTGGLIGAEAGALDLYPTIDALLAEG